MSRPEEILAFWIDEVGQKQWYVASDELDGEITRRFEADWARAIEGGLGLWLTYPSGALAFLIVTDQFSRNMFRGDPRSFAGDIRARAAAKAAIRRDWDLKIDAPARQFFYLPMMHSEMQTDQDQAVRLFKDRMPEAEGSLLHALVHREIIRRFGRFPYRNAALGRSNTHAETAFIEEGGYGQLVDEIKGSG